MFVIVVDKVAVMQNVTVIVAAGLLGVDWCLHIVSAFSESNLETLVHPSFCSRRSFLRRGTMSERDNNDSWVRNYDYITALEEALHGYITKRFCVCVCKCCVCVCWGGGGGDDWIKRVNCSKHWTCLGCLANLSNQWLEGMVALTRLNLCS